MPVKSASLLHFTEEETEAQERKHSHPGSFSHPGLMHPVLHDLPSITVVQCGLNEEPEGP
jgi:hypothetical protein